MTLIPLEIPPGVYANGTDIQSSQRWLDASLVRWIDGTMRPVGGWSERDVTATGKAPRGAFAWEDNSGNQWLALGMYDELNVISAADTLSDITPAGLTAGTEDAVASTGYGAGFYGTARASATVGTASTWSFDNWGENLVACSDADGVLYEWTLNTGSEAATISNAPTDCCGLVVTPERFLFALGAGGDPRKVQWSDREDNTTWTAASTNEAGDLLLQTAGNIRQGLAGRGETIILTSTDAWVATYQGPPFVYGFERAGSACGSVGKRAGVSVNGQAFWMGYGSFFVYGGGSVQEVPCDVADKVFQNLNTAQRSKVYALTNSAFNEIWWFYPTGVECDSYVVYNYREGHWATGSISRTAGVDRGVFQVPIWFSAGGDVYSHEVGNNYGGAEVYAESGPIMIGSGDNVMNVTHLYPDEDTQGDVTATFKTRFYPNGTERDYGPYTMSNPTSVRFTGRQIRLRVVGNTLTDWRFGIPRIDAKTMGRR